MIASHRMCYGGAAAAFFLVLQTSAFAQGQGTEQQQEACTPDAFRLCGAYMPDPGRVEACLRASGPRLSRPCYDVFFPQQDVPPPRPAGSRRRFNGPQPPPQQQQYDDDN